MAGEFITKLQTRTSRIYFLKVLILLNYGNRQCEWLTGDLKYKYSQLCMAIILFVNGLSMCADVCACNHAGSTEQVIDICFRICWFWMCSPFTSVFLKDSGLVHLQPSKPQPWTLAVHCVRFRCLLVMSLTEVIIIALISREKKN